MPNRVIKDLVWSSPSLAKMSKEAQLHWLRWLLMADDWGCFNADIDVIKGLVYPKMKVTLKDIQRLRDEFYDNGKLFIWEENDREWGFFTSWDGHQFCNKTHLDDDGKQIRHKRKTPEPPKELFEEYIKKQGLVKKIEQSRAVGAKYRIPIPNPIPNPNPNLIPMFDKFWDEYPNKQKKSKALEIWEKLNPNDDLIDTILTALRKARKSEQWIPNKDGKTFVPHPTTWLNGKRWEDEYVAVKDTDTPPPPTKCVKCGIKDIIPYGAEDKVCGDCY